MSLIACAISLGILSQSHAPPELVAVLDAVAKPILPASVKGLGPQNVLVVYDSRKLDSLAIAAHYAGSQAVANAPRQTPGTRKGVHVFDLAGVLAEQPLPDGTIDYGQFQKLIRQPLIDHLSQADYAADIRIIVLTKGVPHRIADINVVQTGDQPQLQSAAFEKGNASSASVDSELTLLWQDLRAGEKGGTGDSRADGLIINPYWRMLAPVTRFSNRHVRDAKNFMTGSKGQFWSTDPPSSDPSINSSKSLTPGDMYLVCRLDGNTAGEVIDSLDRAVAFSVNTNTACMIFDECDSNGVADSKPNRELDNVGPEFVWSGDDYELCRDLLLADGRIRKENVYYDLRGGAEGFCIGPRIDCKGKGRVIAGPVLMLASVGGNATGSRLLVHDGRDASTLYPESFQYAPGAIFTSIESFNGRDFGLTGGWPGQAQAANFIKAGGTFAICNAWEPFAFSLPDNILLVGNFVLGNLTWAEAAYSSLPGLSWQQVVIGDPLARTFRQCEDINGDKAIDREDLALFDQILANKGPSGKPIDPMIVSRADINHDGKIDAKDRGFIERDISAIEFYSKQERPKARVEEKP